MSWTSYFFFFFFYSKILIHSVENQLYLFTIEVVAIWLTILALAQEAFESAEIKLWKITIPWI